MFLISSNRCSLDVWKHQQCLGCRHHTHTNLCLPCSPCTLILGTYIFSWQRFLNLSVFCLAITRKEALSSFKRAFLAASMIEFIRWPALQVVITFDEANSTLFYTSRSYFENTKHEGKPIFFWSLKYSLCKMSVSYPWFFLTVILLFENTFAWIFRLFVLGYGG